MLSPKTFQWSLDRGVGTITLTRPERLNALTFESYAELADSFHALNDAARVRVIVLRGEGKGFCSGGDQDDIIAELFSRDMEGLVEFTRLTGRLIANIRKVRRPVIGALHGATVGAGAVMALACDMRIAAKGTKFGFIFPRVGLCGADMGASFLLPRVVGHGNAAELLFRGQLIEWEHALRIGLVNRVVEDRDAAWQLAAEWALELSRGPAFAHSMTKQMMESEWNMSLGEAIESEAQAQAICMQHPDFETAHHAFKNKQTPRFRGAPED